MISLQSICRGGLWTEASTGEMFSDVDQGTEQFSYLTFFVLFVLSLLTPLRAERYWRAIFIGLFLLIITFSADIFPLHAWLFKFVALFHYFRNYFIFWPLLLGFATFLAVTGLRRLTDVTPEARWPRAAWIILVTMAWTAFLLHTDTVPIATYLSMALTCVSLLLILTGQVRWGSTGAKVLLVAAILIQPLFVLSGFRNFLFSRTPLLEPTRGTPTFSYTRPFPKDDAHRTPFHAIIKQRLDDSGFPEWGYIGSARAYGLIQNIPMDILAGYVHFKFVVYPGTMLVDDKAIDWHQAGRLYSFETPNAWVMTPKAAQLSQEGSSPVRITGPSQEFSVERFDANKVVVRTSFSKDRFLVYNDNHHTAWRAFIDGKTVTIERTNIAFKGVWVPSGAHRLEFSFGAWWESAFFWWLQLLFIFMGTSAVIGVRKIEYGHKERH